MTDAILHTSEDLGDEGICCLGAAAMGRCTCWVPVYDREQAPVAADLQPPKPRAGCCGSCGVVDGLDEDLGIADAAIRGRAFYCHQGMRRAVERVHPDGRRRDAGDHDYAETYAPAPAPRRTVPLKADGTCADLCGAWAKWARENGHSWFDRGEWPPERRR
jgi:hypothetical protein